MVIAPADKPAPDTPLSLDEGAMLSLGKSYLHRYETEPESRPALARSLLATARALAEIHGERS